MRRRLGVTTDGHVEYVPRPPPQALADRPGYDEIDRLPVRVPRHVTVGDEPRQEADDLSSEEEQVADRQLVFHAYGYPHPLGHVAGCALAKLGPAEQFDVGDPAALPARGSAPGVVPGP